MAEEGEVAYSILMDSESIPIEGPIIKGLAVRNRPLPVIMGTLVSTQIVRLRPLVILTPRGHKIRLRSTSLIP